MDKLMWWVRVIIIICVQIDYRFIFLVSGFHLFLLIISFIAHTRIRREFTYINVVTVLLLESKEEKNMHVQDFINTITSREFADRIRLNQNYRASYHYALALFLVLHCIKFASIFRLFDGQLYLEEEKGSKICVFVYTMKYKRTN